jgi:hypothetical protein
MERGKVVGVVTVLRMTFLTGRGNILKSASDKPPGSGRAAKGNGGEMYSLIEPLVKRKIFASEEQAIRELVLDYVLHQITVLEQELAKFETKYGLRWERFEEYLHERSMLLQAGTLTAEQRQALGQALMEEEDDWLEWKATRGMLESWLGLRQEAAV